jgi:hypothetical protein
MAEHQHLLGEYQQLLADLNEHDFPAICSTKLSKRISHISTKCAHINMVRYARRWRNYIRMHELEPYSPGEDRKGFLVRETVQQNLADYVIDFCKWLYYEVIMDPSLSDIYCKVPFSSVCVSLIKCGFISYPNVLAFYDKYNIKYPSNIHKYARAFDRLCENMTHKIGDD